MLKFGISFFVSLLILLQVAFTQSSRVIQQTQEVCDEMIQQQLQQQGINYNCYPISNMISIDGGNSVVQLSLILRDTLVLATITIQNCSQLIVDKLILENVQISVPLNKSGFIVLLENTYLQINELSLTSQSDTQQCSYLNIQNNQRIVIQNLNIFYPEGYSNVQNIQGQQYNVYFKDNQQVQITIYNFKYRQCEENVLENNRITGIGAEGQSTEISAVIINIDYTQQPIKVNNQFMLQAIYSTTTIQTIGNIDITLSSLKNIYPINQPQSLIQSLSQTSCSINIITIQNDNLLISVFDFSNIQTLSISYIKFSNVQANAFDQLEVPVQSQVATMISMNQISKITLVSLIFEGCNVTQSYKALYLNVLNNNFISGTTINMNNCLWTNSMVHVFDYGVKDLGQTFQPTISMSGSDFKGSQPCILLQMQGASIVASLNINTNSKVATQNGIIQVVSAKSVTFNSISLNVSVGTFIDLGNGGFFQFSNIQKLTFNSVTFSSQNNQLIQAQFGGLFQILQVQTLKFDSVAASGGFNINGEGGFAYVQASSFQLSNSKFDGFSAKGSGGTIYCTYQNQLQINSVTISNSISNLFGGAAYLKPTTPYTSLSDSIINFTVQNCKAKIGGGINIFNQQESILNNISFSNNMVELFGDDYALPVTKVEILSHGEYNQGQIQQFEDIPRNVSVYYSPFQTNINSNTTQINVIYYATLQLSFGKQIVQYKDLQCEPSSINFSSQNSSKLCNQMQCETVHIQNKKYQKVKQRQLDNCNNNLFSSFYQFPQITNPFNSQLSKTQSPKIINGENILLNMDYQNTKNFYFLYQITQDFTTKYNQLSLFGNIISLQLQKQEDCNIGQIKVTSGSFPFCQYCSNFQLSLSPTSNQCYKCSTQQFTMCSGNIANVKSGYYISSDSSINTYSIPSNTSVILNAKTPRQECNEINNMQKIYQLDKSKNNIKRTLAELEQSRLNNIPESITPQQNLKVQTCNQFPQNCLGGQFTGNNLCLEGHVGPQCLECDRQKIRSSSFYTRNNSYQCKECGSYSQNKGLFIFLCFGLVILMAFFDLILYLQYSGRIQNQPENKAVSLGVHVKYFFFYIQILNVCSYYQQPNILTSIFDFEVNLFNPFNYSDYNFLECFLLQSGLSGFSSPYSLLDLQIIFIIYMNIVYLAIRYLVTKLYILIRKRYYHDYYFNSKGIIYFNTSIFQNQLVYYSLSITSIWMIQSFIQGLFCTSFEGLGSFSNLDLTLQCGDSALIYYRIFLIVPCLFLLCIVLPIYLSLKVKKTIKNREKNEDSLMEFEIDFLISEFKERSYYWELVRFTVKIVIILSISLLAPNNIMIGIYVTFILIVYLLLVICFSPYLVEDKLTNKSSDAIQKLFLGHSSREIIIVISGITMIVLNILTSTANFNQYFSLDSSSTKAISIIANIQAFVIFILLTINIIRHGVLQIIFDYKSQQNNQPSPFSETQNQNNFSELNGEEEEH